MRERHCVLLLLNQPVSSQTGAAHIRCKKLKELKHHFKVEEETLTRLKHDDTKFCILAGDTTNTPMGDRVTKTRERFASRRYNVTPIVLFMEYANPSTALNRNDHEWESAFLTDVRAE